MKKKHLIISFLFAATLVVDINQVFGQSILRKINRTSDDNYLRLFFHFDTLPAYTIDKEGKRVSLILTDTVIEENLLLPTADDKLIKSLREERNKQTALSFFFRYLPQNSKVSTDAKKAILTLQVLLGNSFSMRYPDLPLYLNGVTLLGPVDINQVNPLEKSLYAQDWYRFFREYETPVTIQPAIKFTLPPFPLAQVLSPEDEDSSWLPQEAQALQAQGEWLEIAALLREQMEIARAQQSSEGYYNQLLLTYAESLIRAQELDEPYMLLQKIAFTYRETPLADLAQFLFIYIESLKKPNYPTYYEALALFKGMRPLPSIEPYLILFKAESAMVAGRYKDAERFLAQDDFSYAPQAYFIRQLRQADLFSKTGKPVKALAAYLQLEKNSDILHSHPYSLATLSALLYKNKFLKAATKKYQALSDMLSGKKIQGLALFRLAMTTMHAGEPLRKTRVRLGQIQEAYPYTEGSYRAELKFTDLDFVNKKISAGQALKTYTSLSGRANLVDLREEATLKRAIIFYLLTNKEKALEVCMKLLREFQTGVLRTEAMALMVQCLPDTLEQLLQEKDYIKALVLAKQNRTFFENNWVPSDLIRQMAIAYTSLGLDDRAVQTYRFLLEIEDEDRKEEVYPELIKAMYAAEQYENTAGYADLFFSLYPKSPYADAVLLVQAKALYETKQYEAAGLLFQKRKTFPSLAMMEIAADIYSTLGQWSKVVTILSSPQAKKIVMPEKYLDLLGDAYMETGQFDQAERQFQDLVANGTNPAMYMYKLGKVAKEQGDAPLAMERFQQVVDEQEESLWTRLAREELSIFKIEQGL